MRRVVVLKHALRNALIPVVTLGAIEFGTLLVRRGADRADLHHPRLRQADRRCRVQPRLPGGAGRGAGDRADLRAAQPAGRRAYCAGQSAAAGHDAEPLCRPDHRARPRERARRMRAWRRLLRRDSGCDLRPGVVVLLFVLVALLAPLDRALRSHRHELRTRSASRPPGRTGSAPTRSGATCSRASCSAPAPRCWPASSRSASPLGARRAARAAGGLCRRLDRCAASRASPTPCSRCPS